MLRQQVELYRTYQEKINNCDAGLTAEEQEGSRNTPQFDLGRESYRITGIDWSQISGMDVVTAQTVIAECGADLSAFSSAQQFIGWLGLVPTNEQRGGKILKRRTRKVVNRAATVFRNPASTLVRSQSYLGAQYLRLRARLGRPRPSPPWRVSSPACSPGSSNSGQQYVAKGIEYYAARYREQQIRSLIKRAKKLGFQLVAPHAPDGFR